MRRFVIGVMAVAAGCAPALSRPTARRLSEAELRSHLLAFAHDSMLGRRGGTEGGVRASRYIADRLARAGLKPGGQNGTFYQPIPLVRRIPDTTSVFLVGGRPLTYGRDFLPTSARWRAPRLEAARVVFLGSATRDTTGWPPRQSLRGKVALFYDARAIPPAPTQPRCAARAGQAATDSLCGVPAVARLRGDSSHQGE